MFFSGGWGGEGFFGRENGVMYFMNLSVPHFVYLLIIYVFIGFYLSLFDLHTRFQGFVRGLYLQRGVLQIVSNQN